jgi:hypothetical protein
MLFKPGSLLATPAAINYLTEHDVSLIKLIDRHCGGDWGDLCSSDKKLNDQAVRDGSRIVSAYTVASAYSGERDRSFRRIVTAAHEMLLRG